jgi:spermidine dehydrogenase
MTGEITRRDFLGATLLASGAALLDGLSPAELLARGTAEGEAFNGYGGVGEYGGSNGNTWEVLQAGHTIRDKVYERMPKDVVETGEKYDCVVVGGGISGLAAGLFFQRNGGEGKNILLLENHAIFGGEAKQNEFEVDGRRLTTHQGSAIYQVAYPHSFLAGFYDSIGLKKPQLEYQKWAGGEKEMALSRTPYESVGMERGEYGFWFGKKFGSATGKWVKDPLGTKLEGAPISAVAREEWMRWLKGERVAGKTFEAPRFEGDASSRYLDTITLEQHYMEQFGMSQEFVRTFLSPVEGGGSGLGPDALSGYSEYAFETLHPLPGEPDQMFPGGNTTIARLMAKSFLPAAIDGENSVDGITRHGVNFAALDAEGAAGRMRLGATVVSVEHEGEARKAEWVAIVYAKEGKLYRVRAKSVVMAGGCWTTKHIVRDLPQAQRGAYGEFYRSPCVMANVAVRNWRFLYKMGMSGCRWFTGFGNYLDVVRQALVGNVEATIGPDSPVVFSVKALFAYPGLATEAQGVRGRTEMLGTSFKEYEGQIREQFQEMFAAGGFHAGRDIAGIILNRWGHAYLNPQPGFFFGRNGKRAPREILREAPFGRIAFANTDLAGAMDHRFSILEAKRAVGQLLDGVVRE